VQIRLEVRCRLGTFISSYGQRGECWLATTSLQTALPCIRHCESFVKVKKSHAIETRIRPKMPSTNESNGQASAVLSVVEQGAVVLAENSIPNSTLKAAPAQSSLDHLNCSKSKGFCPVGKYSAMSPWTHHASCYLCPSSKFVVLWHCPHRNLQEVCAPARCVPTRAAYEEQNQAGAGRRHRHRGNVRSTVFTPPPHIDEATASEISPDPGSL
jgi:hypothetical protein